MYLREDETYLAGFCYQFRGQFILRGTGSTTTDTERSQVTQQPKIRLPSCPPPNLRGIDLERAPMLLLVGAGGRAVSGIFVQRLLNLQSNPQQCRVFGVVEQDDQFLVFGDTRYDALETKNKSGMHRNGFTGIR